MYVGNMFYFFLLELLRLEAGWGSGEYSCKLQGKFDLPELSKDGDVILGGLFNLHMDRVENVHSFTVRPKAEQCKRFDFRGFRLAQTMIFAIEEINRNHLLLPNVTLGFRIHDDCASSKIVTKAALALVNGQETGLGYSCTGQSNVIGIVSYFSTCVCLSNRNEYPVFYRTIPSDYHQSKALAQIIKKFGWTWIGTIRSNNDYGNFGMQAFVDIAQELDICIAFSESFYRTDSHEKIRKIVNVIKSSTTKVIVAFVPMGEMRILLKEIISQNVTGIQWIGTEGWTTSQLISPEESARFLIGTIGPAIPMLEVKGLREFLLKIHPSSFPGNAFVKEFWETVFQCTFPSGNTSQITALSTWQQCTGKEDLTQIHNVYSDVSVDGSSYNVYKAVYAFAHALHNMLSEKSATSQVCSYLSTLFEQTSHAMFMQNLIIVPFPDSTDCIKCPEQYWPNQQRDRCLPKEIEFLSFTEMLGGVLLTLALVGVSTTISIAFVFFTHRDTPIVKANNSELSYLLLFALTLCFLCSVTFIGEPSVWACMLCHTAFAIAFVLCISCILIKTILVILAFKATLPNNNMAKLFGPAQQRWSVFLLTSVQCLICTLWLTISHPFPMRNTEYYREIIILECDLGSVSAFYSMAGYIAFLAGVSFVLAFLARKLPDNFNEAQCITFSMLIFCAVWITFIPVYISSPGKYTVAVEVFAILASSCGLLFCIFVPKCYIILIKPEMNTKKHLMGKVPVNK
uniref:Extracellular calcium-sensing receptor-like n=1 Tax=Callorhinchus milii TaxID=7868 RepID=A0A4W3HIW0_CALMI